jgi:hypothetical protein
MKLVDSMTAGLFETTKDGRRVYLPWRWSRTAYLVSDADAARMRRILRWYFAIALFVFIPAFVIFASGSTAIYGVGLAFIAATAIGMRAWLTVGLTRTVIGPGEMVRMTYRDRLIEQGLVVGQSTLSLMLVAGVVMDVGQAFVAFTDGDWWAWLGIVMFTTMSIMIAWQIQLVRKSRVSRV